MNLSMTVMSHIPKRGGGGGKLGFFVCFYNRCTTARREGEGEGEGGREVRASPVFIDLREDVGEGDGDEVTPRDGPRDGTNLACHWRWR